MWRWGSKNTRGGKKAHLKKKIPFKKLNPPRPTQKTGCFWEQKTEPKRGEHGSGFVKNEPQTKTSHKNTQVQKKKKEMFTTKKDGQPKGTTTGTNSKKKKVVVGGCGCGWRAQS